MEISQLRAALTQALPLREGGADESQIAAFQQKLAAGRTALPEQALVDNMQIQQAQLVKGIEESKAITSLSPESALALQFGLANSVVGVDMVAKVAGSFSQAINKLVTMQ